MSPDAFQKDVAQYGDCVIIDLGSFKNLTTVLKKGDVLQTRFGALRHDDCVGKKYGSKIQTSRGYVYILALSPALWSETLPHRTQIIYPCDASLIVGGLDLAPGKWVFEAGTGSGSLTHFLAQAVLPHGHVHTFDFHSERVKLASEEFNSHSLGDVVKVDIRDVCNDYFPPIGSELNPNGVDAVVLDLPRPWVVIPHLGRTLRPDSRQQTASIWLQSGFSEYMSSVSQFNKHLLPPPKTSEIENIHCKRSHPNPELGKSINPKQLKGIESSTKVENSFTWEPILQVRQNVLRFIKLYFFTWVSVYH
ncbi:tRNA (adenine57-N1/adenine58-N1)-methyltransferase catalytic subunit [Schistosoma bovis]|uniref:tRNA (adenine(58)-N(1))-methyltransferase n=1 Tax=Schistosoma bovis TaxID=6184 RepID=A0A430QN29_SCHBO|nr:tRNA (adenine57-N1/adenine58-N1)-methyltransferase catalytic subunit [Schistosoma bovis]